MRYTNKIFAGSYQVLTRIDLDRFMQSVPVWFADRIIHEDEVHHYPFNKEYNVSVTNDGAFIFGFGEDQIGRYSGSYQSNKLNQYSVLVDFGSTNTELSSPQTLLAAAQQEVTFKNSKDKWIYLPRWVYEEVLSQTQREQNNIYPYSDALYVELKQLEQNGELKEEIVLVKNTTGGTQKLMYFNGDSDAPRAYWFKNWYESFDLDYIMLKNDGLIDWKKDRIGKEMVYRNLISNSIAKHTSLLKRKKKLTSLKVPGKIGAAKKRLLDQLDTKDNQSQEMEKALTDKEAHELSLKQVPDSILELIPENLRKDIYLLKQEDKTYPHNKIIVDRNVWGWGNLVAITDETATVSHSFSSDDLEDRRRKTLRKNFMDALQEKHASKYSTKMVPVSGTRIPEWLLNAIPHEYWHRITPLSPARDYPDRTENEIYQWPFLFTTSDYNVRLRLAPPANFHQDVYIDFSTVNTVQAIDKKLEELEKFFSIYKEMYVTPLQKFKKEIYDLVDSSKLEKKMSYGGTLTVATILDRTNGTSEMFFFDKRTEMLMSHEYYNQYGLHNEHGPAIVRYNNDGSINVKQFYVDGKQHTEKEWKHIIESRFESFKGRNKDQNLDESSKATPVVVGLTTGLTGITVKTMSKLEKVKEIAKSDAKIVAKRVAVEKISQVLQKALVEIMTRNLKGKQKSALAKNLVEFFDTEKGRAVLQFFAGVGLPMIAAHIPDKYHHILEEVSTEFRVQGETTVMLEAIGAVQPLIMMATSGVLDAFKSGAEEETKVPVRVHVDTVTHNTHAEHEVEAAHISAANKVSK